MANIIIGIVFIIGGASGKLVLRGTDSSGALMVVGALLLIWGLYSTIKNYTTKQKALHNPILENEEIKGFYMKTKDAWALGKLDFLDLNFKKASGMTLESFIGSFPPSEENALGLFFSNFKPLPDEFMVGIGNSSSRKGWFVLTNLRLIQKDGQSKKLYAIPLESISEFKTKGSWTKELTFVMKNGETLNLSKVEIFPNENYIRKLIENRVHITEGQQIPG
ncbi:MAG: PH domain-containing protein [Clostridia bacterium]|nr:PH domain-containing protein [Clostridia bacterium]